MSNTQEFPSLCISNEILFYLSMLLLFEELFVPLNIRRVKFVRRAPTFVRLHLFLPEFNQIWHV